ncbi:PD-(D/E)XK nuclease domain-containing protein [Bacteroides salyersiae]|nr:PD-(D/E)XK nuclease domain-containing protein [Bacteroides salyersiae]
MITPLKKERINEKGYLIPYIADGRTLVKVGVNFSQKERNIEHWIIE